MIRSYFLIFVHGESMSPNEASYPPDRCVLMANCVLRGSKQVRNGNYTQKDFFVVLPALLYSAQTAGQLFSLAPEVTRAKAGAQSVFALHDEKPSIITESAAAKNETVASGLSLMTGPSTLNGRSGKKGELEFRGVSLYYDTRPTVPALNNVSFLIQNGEYVAFVGRSVRHCRAPIRRIILTPI